MCWTAYTTWNSHTEQSQHLWDSFTLRNWGTQWYNRNESLHLEIRSLVMWGLYSFYCQWQKLKKSSDVVVPSHEKWTAVSELAWLKKKGIEAKDNCDMICCILPYPASMHGINHRQDFKWENIRKKTSTCIFQTITVSKRRNCLSFPPAQTCGKAQHWWPG